MIMEGGTKTLEERYRGRRKEYSSPGCTTYATLIRSPCCLQDFTRDGTFYIETENSVPGEELQVQ